MPKHVCQSVKLLLYLAAVHCAFLTVWRVRPTLQETIRKNQECLREQRQAVKDRLTQLSARQSAITVSCIQPNKAVQLLLGFYSFKSRLKTYLSSINTFGKNLHHFPMSLYFSLNEFEFCDNVWSKSNFTFH